MLWGRVEQILVTAVHRAHSAVRVIESAPRCSRVAAHVRDENKGFEARSLYFKPGSTCYQLCDSGQLTSFLEAVAS